MITNKKLRNFGIVMGTFFFLISLYFFFNSNDINLIFISSFLLSLLLFILSYLKPYTLLFFYKFWIQFGFLLQRIISPILLFLIYSLIITPTGLILRLVGKDILNFKLNIKSSSYWINKPEDETIPVKMRDQF